MATISSPGIGSGLDINSLITQMVAVEKQPLQKLQKEASSLQTKISTYGQIQSAVSGFRDAADALTKATTWSPTASTASDPTAVGISAGPSAKAGSYTVEVQKLATPQMNSTGYFESADTPVGEGSITIELGAWSEDGSSFTPKPGASPVRVSFGPPAESLALLRDKINSSAAGVVASVITDSGGSRLILRSSTTGEENGFKITTEDADGNNSDGLGLSALAFDPSAGILTMAKAMSASNANALLNGISINSSTNTLTNVVDGISLTLSKVTPAPVQVNVNQDTASVRKSVDNFVSAYNSLNKMLADQTRFNGPNANGPQNLQGDSTAVSLRNQMRSIMGNFNSGSSTFKRLSDIGIELQRDGSVSVNSAKLDKSLENVTEVKNMFATVSTPDAPSIGLAMQIKSVADRSLAGDGLIANRNEGLRKRLNLNQDRQENEGSRIAQVEKRLRAQYTALDRQMGALNGQASYVSQQITLMNKSS
jgi:flagellar hook-associated protein 2